MADRPDHHSGHGIAPLIFGVFVGSQLHKQHHRPPPVGQNSPLRGLDARQAMIAVSFGRILGLIAMAVFLAFYTYIVWHL
jgi:hypothetical protein